MKVIKYAELENHVGQEIGHSEWVTIEQDRVNKFADATGDHQWIHLDVERANASCRRRARSRTAI